MSQDNTVDSNGLGFLNLGKGWMPLEYLVMVKCLDPKGQVRYREMSSTTLHPVEALGMLTTMGDTMRGRLMKDARQTRDWDQ
jgi:hypothetical protein